jgi:hypothetical protein
MSETKLKVLELVAEGKITPEDAVRLIEALGDEAPPRGGNWRLDLPELHLPKIDLGHLGEVCVELKNAAVEGARKAQGAFQRSRAARYLEFKDYPLAAALPDGAQRCRLELEVSAGKLKLRGETQAELLSGRVKRVPEAPVVLSEMHDGVVDLRVKHSLGRCGLHLSDALPYEIKLANSASDSSLQLESLAVSKLSLDNNAGNVSVALGDKLAPVEVAVSNNAGNVRLRLPATHSVRISVQGNLSSHNLDRCGLELIDGVARSGDWETNPLRVDILLTQNVAGFILDWKRRDGVQVGEAAAAPAAAPGEIPTSDD